ncbi:DUF4147 domain-containing protein [Candidatus Peregrinibacteria bacterium]|nr:DUF4147 domain-containing protein [Candidatus Peregrinibacteria bacterium]
MLKNRFSLRTAHALRENFESARKPYQVQIRRGVVKNVQPKRAHYSRKDVFRHVPKIMRKILLEIAKWTLAQCKPQNLFKNVFEKKSLCGFERIAVISIGKASRGMAKEVLKMLPKKPDALLFADSGHPLPTKKSVKNTQKIIKLARSLGKKDLSIILISGGGSAMLTCPVPFIALNDKINITKALLKSGATINEMNVVRKHLSQVKGGNLAALFYPATVFGFVISDVVGNDLSTIASGPISPDKSTFSDAIRILKKYNIAAPKKVWAYLKQRTHDKKLETPKKGSKYFEKINIKILADHSTVLKNAADRARKLGLKIKIVPKLITGEARHAAKIFVKMARPKTLIIAGGETTVTCRGKIWKGCGGRNQEFVLSGLKYLKPNQTLLSIGTDGVDGICPEKIAGAIADKKILTSAQKQNLKIEDFLKRNDSYTFFKKTKGLIATGPTGTNLGDLMMLFS